MRTLTSALSIAALSAVAVIAPATAANAAPIPPESFGSELDAAAATFKANIAGKPILVTVPKTDSGPETVFYFDPSGAMKMEAPGTGDIGVCRAPSKDAVVCYSKKTGEAKWKKTVTKAGEQGYSLLGEGNVVDEIIKSNKETLKVTNGLYLGGADFDKTVNGDTTILSYGGEVVGSTPSDSASSWTTLTFTPTSITMKAVVTATGEPDTNVGELSIIATDKQAIKFPKKSQIKK